MTAVHKGFRRVGQDAGRRERYASIVLGCPDSRWLRANPIRLGDVESVVAP